MSRTLRGSVRLSSNRVQLPDPTGKITCENGGLDTVATAVRTVWFSGVAPQGEASYVGQSHGKNAYDSCLPKAVSVLGCFLATHISWITDGSSRSPG